MLSSLKVTFAIYMMNIVEAYEVTGTPLIVKLKNIKILQYTRPERIKWMYPYKLSQYVCKNRNGILSLECVARG